LGTKHVGRYVTIAIAALVLSGCGVRFSEEFEGTELFKTMWLTEQVTGGVPEVCAREGATWVCRPGARLSVNTGITNGYPVPVRVACYYEDPDALTEDDEKLTFAERATFIGEAVLSPSEGARPDTYAPRKAKDAASETLSFAFDAPAPGSYFLACLTPAAADNGLGIAFKIER
jgi:hypothetical protein